MPVRPAFELVVGVLAVAAGLAGGGAVTGE
jgi:hypothetical protein